MQISALLMVTEKISLNRLLKMIYAILFFCKKLFFDYYLQINVHAGINIFKAFVEFLRLM